MVSVVARTTSCPSNFDRSKMSTLSAATTHDHESPSTPTYSNGEPILYTGNPAELTGILEALDEHFINNGLFQPLQAALSDGPYRLVLVCAPCVWPLSWLAAPGAWHRAPIS